VADGDAAINRARHEPFDPVVVVAAGYLASDAAAIFNLRCLNPLMDIILLIGCRRKNESRSMLHLIGSSGFCVKQYWEISPPRHGGRRENCVKVIA
jgi:hypothetical protein